MTAFENMGGASEDFIERWARDDLPPRKRREGSISVSEHYESSTLFSYAVPIASLWRGDPKRYVIGTRNSLERTSMTTNKHLRWARRNMGPAVPTIEIIQGKVPETDGDWGIFLLFFDVVRSPSLSTEAQALWREHQAMPHEQQVWSVLCDMYLEAGFGQPEPGRSIFLDPQRGFIIGNRHGADVVVR